jgi:hypothetical protein
VLTAEELVAAGYREYKPGVHDRFARSFSKRMTNERGIKYAVQVRYWEHPEGSEKYAGWDALVQFNTHGEQPTFNVELLSCSNMTPAQVENFFENIFWQMGCDYYEQGE